MPALSNDPDRCELLNLGWGAGGHGPYLVRQEGHVPGTGDFHNDFFILQQDGRWLINLAFVMLPEAEQEKQLFHSPAEVIQCLDELRVKSVQADAEIPPGATSGEVMAHFENCANRILRGMRTGSVMPVHTLPATPIK
jgi:hypothetical protein